MGSRPVPGYGAGFSRVNCSVRMRLSDVAPTYLLTRGSTWTGDSASRPYLHTTGFTAYDGVTDSSSLSLGTYSPVSTWTGDSESRPYLHTTGFPRLIEV